MPLLCRGYDEFYVDREVRIEFGGVSVALTRVNEELISLRLESDSAERFRATVHAPDWRPVAIMPHLPIGGRLSSECLLVRFPYETYVPPGEDVTLQQLVPVDVGLYSGGALIAVVPVRPRYALYGPPDLGSICRYASHTLVQDLDPCLRASFNVKLVNNSKVIVRASRVIVPLRGLGLYLTSMRLPVLTSVKLVAFGQSHAEVTTELLPSIEVEGFSRLLVAPSVVTYIMRYGI